MNYKLILVTKVVVKLKTIEYINIKLRIQLKKNIKNKNYISRLVIYMHIYYHYVKYTKIKIYKII